MTNARILSIKTPYGEILEVRFEPALLERLYKYQPVHFENLRAVHYVLSHPKRIFVGIKRAVSMDGLCFVGQPETWYIREGRCIPFPKDKLVFAVYLNSRKSVYDFRAEKIDYEDPLSPLDWKNRFGGLKWKSAS